jgi:hypothetical protein
MVPVMLATFVGIASGVYIFDPLLKQYAMDSRGTYDPKIAQASAQGGVGGGLVDSVQNAVEKGKEKAQQSATIGGQEARKKLEEVITASDKAQKKTER